MTGIMALFGGGKKPDVMPTPPPPRIGDAAGEAATREERYRAKRKYGVEDTMLGSPAAAPASVPTPKRTMLG